MKKNHSQKTTNHIQLGGQAFYDEHETNNFFMFAPDDPQPGQVARFRRRGIAQQMSDGSFDFVPKPKQKSKATLIRKVAHGRVSHTKDNAIYIYLKVFCDEGINISEAIAKEAYEVTEAVRDYQLKR